MIDSHCHLAGEEFADDLQDVVHRAIAAGVTAALVVIAMEIDPVAGRALDLRQPVVRALAWKISVPTNVVGVALELGGCGRGLEKAPCEESERSLDKASHWVFTFGSFSARNTAAWLPGDSILIWSARASQINRIEA